MKTQVSQALGIMLVSLLAVSSIAYIASFQQPGPIPVTTYEVKNFDSYHSFTSFLQTSGNTMYNSYGASAAPRANGVVALDELAIGDGKSMSQGGATVDFSETNVQVEGVDEPDIVKTDGTYLYIVSDNKVIIVSAYPAENAQIEVTITVNENLTIQNIFISGSRLVIFAQSYMDYPILYNYAVDGMKGEELMSTTPWYSSPNTYITIYSLETITSPAIVKEVVVPGQFSHARLIGDYIYVITTQYSYDTQSLGEDASITPRITVDSKPVDIPLSDIYYVDIPEKSSTLTNIVSVNVQNDDEQTHAKIFLLGNSQTVYVSQNNIYVTYTTWSYYNYDELQQLVDDVIMPILPDTVKSQLEAVKTLDLADYQKQEITFWILQNYVQNSMPEAEKRQMTRELIRNTEQTIIHRISINDGEITYEAQGSVPGYINNQFSLDEYNGNLRVSTTLQGSSISYIFGSINPETNVYVLDSQLQIIGSLEDITPDTGESIYATRFVGPTCYLVTFKQTDPFLVIDLSTPTDPAVLGELKIPGYSTYLHPYDDTHVIGIGRNGSVVKVALYDITDMNNPVELGIYQIQNSEQDSYWWTESAALYEHKAFLFDKDKALLVIPAGNYSQQSAYVFHIALDSGITLKGVVTHAFERSNPVPTYYWWGASANSIQRSLFIDNTLYTISENGIVMNDLDSLAQLNSIQLIS